MPAVKLVRHSDGWIGNIDFDFAPRVGETIILPTGPHKVETVLHAGEPGTSYSLTLHVKEVPKERAAYDMRAIID